MSQLQFEDYYRKNHEALTSFALKLAKNKMDADDLVQETAIKAFRNFNSFIKGSNFKNWAFTILKNTFINKYNKRKKSRIVSLPIEEMNHAIVDKDKYEQVNDPHKILSITSKIDKLSQKSKEPLIMFIKGHQYQEIAEKLEIPVGTVKSRISYARTKLRSMISPRKAM